MAASYQSASIVLDHGYYSIVLINIHVGYRQFRFTWNSGGGCGTGARSQEIQTIGVMCIHELSVMTSAEPSRTTAYGRDIAVQVVWQRLGVGMISHSAYKLV